MKRKLYFQDRLEGVTFLVYLDKEEIGNDWFQVVSNFQFCKFLEMKKFCCF